MPIIKSLKPILLLNLWVSLGKLDNTLLQDKTRLLLHRAITTSSVNEVSIRCLTKMDELEYLIECLMFSCSYRSGVSDEQIMILCAYMYNVFAGRLEIEDDYI